MKLQISPKKPPMTNFGHFNFSEGMNQTPNSSPTSMHTTIKFTEVHSKMSIFGVEMRLKRVDLLG
jgi:hypothetical protein